MRKDERRRKVTIAHRRLRGREKKERRGKKEREDEIDPMTRKREWTLLKGRREFIFREK